MLTNLAALGIGLITAVAAPVAAAQVPCDPVVYPGANYPSVPAPAAYPSASYPTYGVPVPAYTPVPTYAPVPVYTPVPAYSPVPVYVPASPPSRRRDSTPVTLRRADHNRDGGITFAEAYAYGRGEFARSDLDGNGVLTRRELSNRYDEIAIGASRRDTVVTFAEYDASLRHQFNQLDRNRDGFLSRYELGGERSQPNVVTFNWHWEL